MAKEYWLKFETGNPTTLGLAPTFTVFRSWTGGAVSPPGITQQLASYGLYRFEFAPSFSIVFVCDGATSSLTNANRYVVGTLDPLDSVDERLAEFGSTLVAIGTTGVALGTTMVAIGTTHVAQGTTLIAIGTTNIALGTTSVALGTTSIALGTTAVAIGSTGLAFGQTNAVMGLTLLGYGLTLLGYGTSIYAQGQSGGANFTDLLNRIGTTASSFGTTSVDPGDMFGFLKRLQELQEGQASFDKSTGTWLIQTRGATLLRSRTLSNSASSVTKT